MKFINHSNYIAPTTAAQFEMCTMTDKLPCALLKNDLSLRMAQNGGKTQIR